MKKLSLILAIVILLLSTGCSDTKQTSVTFKSPEYISDYERAEFEKFNSPAEKNGLGGTLIYVDGVFETIFELENCFYGRLKSGVNKWCVLLSTTQETVLSQLSFLENKNIRIFGVYQGFAQNLDMPMLSCQKLTLSDTGESYSILEFMSSIAPVFDGAKTAAIESGKELNPKSEKAKSKESISGISAHKFISDFTSKSGINMELTMDTEHDDYIHYMYGNANDTKELGFDINEDKESKTITSISIVFLNQFIPEAYCTALKILDDSITSDEQAMNIYNKLVEEQKTDSSGFGFAKNNGYSHMINNPSSGGVWVTIRKQ